MIKSMTGFASLTSEQEDATLTVTVRSVNHRHLDLQLRLPAPLARLEPAFRALVPRYVARGRVEIALGVQWRQSPGVEVMLNEELAAAVAAAVDRARAGGLVAGPMAPGDLLRLPQVLSIRERAIEEDPAAFERVAGGAEQALTAALRELDAMREREGRFLRTDLEARCGTVADLVERLAAAAERGRGALEARLAQRVRELPLELQGDAAAVAQEVVRFVARSDISEELVRFRGHVAHWAALIDEDEPCGRRLDFLLQEMNREVNTIGSKAEGVEVPELVVAAKAELERMREQVQNVE